MTDRTNAAQPLLGFAEVGPDKELWEYAALVTSLDAWNPHCENAFDELKNQCLSRERDKGAVSRHRTNGSGPIGAKITP